MRKYYPLFLTALSVLAIIISLAIYALTASAKELDMRQLAAQDLPRVLQVIMDTQEAHDRNENALLYKARLLACIDRGECEGTNSAVVPLD